MRTPRFGGKGAPSKASARMGGGGLMRLLPVLALVALGGPAALSASVVHAQGTIFVSPTGTDSPTCGTSSAAACATISQAVTNAVSGDTIQVASGTSYTDQITIPGGKTLTIRGGNPFVSAETVVHLKTLAVGTTGSVLTVQPGATLTVQGVTFTGGTGTTVGANVYGGNVFNQGTLNLVDTTTQNGTASATGGSGLGGDIYSGGAGSKLPAPAQLLVQFSYVGASTPPPPGSPPSGGNAASGSVAGEGGAIYNDFDSVFSVVCSLIAANTATGTGTGIGSGGAIFNASTDTTTVIQPLGTAYHTTGNTVFNTPLIFNTASGPGAANAGGAIENTGALTLNDNTLSGNTATGAATGGGALGGAIDSSGTLTINNNTIAQNSAIGIAGAAPPAPVGVAAVGGVGIAAGGAINLTGAATLHNVTIGDNTATGSVATGGGIAGAANATLANTLLARNTAVVTPTTTITPADCDAAVGTDGGGNIDDDGTCGFTAGAGSVSHSATIGLGPLADNGGDNQTMAITYPTSSAVDIGIASVCEALIGPDGVTADTDERGLPRHAVTRGKCDSGAFDTGGAITLPNTVTGALVLPGIGRLGFAASTDRTSNVGYITLQDGTSSLIVRQPVAVSCLNQCLGTAAVPLPGPVAETLTGTGIGKGPLFSGAHTVVVTLTIYRPVVNTPFGPSLGNPTVSAVSVSVDGKTIATVSAPFPNNGKVQYAALSQNIP